MALLAEYALTPDIFDQSLYSSGEVADIHLRNIKEVLLNEGLVRDLRDGEWSRLFNNDNRPWNRKGKELLRKLITQRRLNRCMPARHDAPATDEEWCREALESHISNPLEGIVSTTVVAEIFKEEPIVAPITGLANAPWWSGRSPSVRLARKITAYLVNLKLVLSCANSVIFIDPHLDPSEPRYYGFIDVLNTMSGRSPAPLIEIHRASYKGSGSSRTFPTESDWKDYFNSLSESLHSAGLSATVFIWDDFHDRYVISDLVGISVPNGFDTTTDPDSLTTWTRMGRRERDDVQREFDPASARHRLRFKFTVGATSRD